MIDKESRAGFLAMICLAALFAGPQGARADGKVVPPRDYQGSLEERAQEAIIVFHGSDEPAESTEDLILKIRVEGTADNFAWVIPFPNEPKIEKEDLKLFEELFAYVEARRIRPSKGESRSDGAKSAPATGEDREPVDVLSRQVVGEFDVAVVRENEEGGLNPWLEREGFQTLDNADDVLDFYRQKQYVFACVKVSSEALAKSRTIESHPLRFTFKTGGRDGVYFPMKMTSLQATPFDVNLYVFYRFWLNDKLSPFGYQHRGFHLHYRDWDSPQCEANGGKAYSLPEEDPFLRSLAHRLTTITKYFQKLHPGQKYYLTNIQAVGLKPQDVRAWPDDLWLFPYYTNRNMIPYDARPDGPAHSAYPDAKQEDTPAESSSAEEVPANNLLKFVWLIGASLVVAVVAVVVRRRWC